MLGSDLKNVLTKESIEAISRAGVEEEEEQPEIESKSLKDLVSESNQYKDFEEKIHRRMNDIEAKVNEMIDRFNKAVEYVKSLEKTMNSHINNHPSAPKEQPGQESRPQQEKSQPEKDFDRNGYNPNEIKLEDYFNFSGKR